MVDAYPRLRSGRRGLALGSGLLLLCGLIAGPANPRRADSQTQKADPKAEVKAEPKQPPASKVKDVLVGGGVEQVNFINEQLDKKWQENKIKPAPRTADYAFIRRA